jgi:hypothetical protein
MPYTPLRDEHTDLYGGSNTNILLYNAVRAKLLYQIQQFKSFADAVDDAQTQLTAEEQQERWDLIAPSVEHANALEADASDMHSMQLAVVNPELHGHLDHYDIGVEMSLSETNNTDTRLCRYTMPDADYYSLMQTLNFAQLQFIYDVVHLIKTTRKQICKFLSGGWYW